MPNNNHVVVKTSNKFNVAVSPSATVKTVGVHNARIDDGYLILIMDDLSEINVGMVQGEPGEDGISVVGVRYANGILYLNMSDGTEYTVGTVRGEDGVSPEVSVVTIQGGHRVVFTDASGDHGFNVMDGTDGVSPEISVEDIANGHRVTITDATGTNVFDVENGTDGDDGVSPTVEIIEISGGHKVTFTDASGEHSFNVMDGTGGGTSIHSQLTGRNDADQHPMNAITGLLTALESKMDADTPIPDEVTEQTVSGWGFTKNTGTYVKPSTGIPKTDLASSVQTSLGKADNALQSVPSTYRTAAAQDDIDALIQDDIDDIAAKIPTQASSTNQLADRNFVNSSIENVAAYYITKNSAGDPFGTYAELANATTVYSGGIVRVPTRNDYTIVLADEEHTDTETGEIPTSRYMYDSGWKFQYVVNNSGLTSDQLAAVNSGITPALVNKLQNIDGGTKSSTQQITLSASGWSLSGDRYYQTKAVSGITLTTPVILVDVVLTGSNIDTDIEVLDAWQIVSANNVVQGNGSLTFYAHELPSVDIPVNVGVC